jgi:hypothetical protein
MVRGTGKELERVGTEYRVQGTLTMESEGNLKDHRQERAAARGLLVGLEEELRGRTELDKPKV